GLGAAVDAAARGYRTLLLEAYDFAKGTSSRSTKLVHGGVRYLARGELGLVREALYERGLLRRNAPHLVGDLAFVVPAYSWWGIAYYGLGLKLYDWLAGPLGLGDTRWISHAEALRRAPTLRADHLRGGLVYYDGQFDDARLAIALLLTALDLGATALNYAPVTGFEKQGGRIAQVRARDAETGEEFAVAARAVLNATGVYADHVRRLDDPEAPPLLAPSQGAHLVLDRSFLPGDAAVMIPRTDDGRVLFAIPWHDRVVLGTTDTPIHGTPIEPRPLAEEVAFLREHAARYFGRAPEGGMIRSLYAGLRPLLGVGGGRATATLSREHAVEVSDAGLVTITGGKWTTYRRMAADAVNRAAAVGGLPSRPCPTADLRLHGGTEVPTDGPLASYGSDRPAVERLCAERPDGSEPLHPDLPYRTGEVLWAARHELARTVEDVLARRTRALLLDARASRAAAPRVAALLAEELGHDEAWQRSQVQQFEALASGYLPP
ncbi:MAG: glycerol-3-phosphate dehydrogenase/oxidase, partial [Isosphaeraceae bacterium]|nr:glycerol-3-phosphate dehydrogenase/oxidase [Isosphaeraceae bacterium]